MKQIVSTEVCLGLAGFSTIWITLLQFLSLFPWGYLISRDIPEYQQHFWSISHLSTAAFHCRSGDMFLSLNIQVRDSESFCIQNYCRSDGSRNNEGKLFFCSADYEEMCVWEGNMHEHTTWLEHTDGSVSMSPIGLSGMNGSFCLFPSLIRWAETSVLTISLLPLASNFLTAAS